MSRFSKLSLFAALLIFTAVACHKQVNTVPEAKASRAQPAPAPATPVKKEPVPPKKAEPPKEQVQKETVKVGQLVTANEIVDRQPKGETETFSIPSGADSVKVFTWNRVLGAKGETNIKHIYYFSGKKLDEVTLKINGPSYRTWSSKQIDASHRGDWKVEVTDEQGNVLASRQFTVAKSEAPAAAANSQAQVNKEIPGTAPAPAKPEAKPQPKK